MRRCRSLRFSLFSVTIAVAICAGISSQSFAQQPATQPATRPATRPAAQARVHSLTGDIRYHSKFHSNILPTDRDIIVYLPLGYEADTQKRYPVFYMHDGQNLFDGFTSFQAGNEWHMDETAQSLIQSGEIEPIIIVGIYNTGGQRTNEYTQVAGTGRYASMGGGKGNEYGRLLVEELKPFIDSTYRTLKDAKNTGLGGSSLGGLISMHLATKYPDVFGKIAVISPSVFWGDRNIVKEVEALPAHLNQRIWLDIGTKEGSNPDSTRDDTRMLRDALIAKGWKLDSDLKYFEDEGAEHNERFWARRADQILKFLFPKEAK